MLKRKKKGRSVKTWDELGNTGDGGLAILAENGDVLHRAPPPVTAAIRYFVSRALLVDESGLPARLAVTSALRREGVTFISKSLGAVLAYDHPYQVAVVDLNWWSAPRRKQDAADDAGGLGIADAIESGVSLDDILVQTSNPRLALVPAGDVAISRRPGLARSAELAEMLGELEKRFDILILDVPAVRATSDAINLIRQSDDFVLVVRQGVTSEDQVTGALADIGGSEPLGVILNRFSTKIPRRLGQLLGT
jgi:Mrp family chromosome partitioning ATPase